MRAVPDVPAPRQSLEDLRGLSDDLEVLVRAVRDLAALCAEIDAGLHRPPTPSRAGARSRPTARTVGRTPSE